MAKHDFKTLKPQIETAVNAAITKPGFPIDPKGYSLTDGFVYAPIQDSVGNDAPYNISGRSVPMVMIIGNSNGQVFYFAVGTLLPKVKF